MKTNYNPIFENLIKSFSGVPNDVSENPNGFIKSVLDAHLTQCEECGVYTGIILTDKNGHKFCSDDCKDLFNLGREESKDADKFDSERDASIEDTFEDYLNESKEFEL